MKLVTVFCIFILATGFIFAQSLVWQQQFPSSYILHIAPDPFGNTYVAQDNGYLSNMDSLKKFDAAMNLRWSIQVPRGFQALVSSAGVYWTSQTINAPGVPPFTGSVTFVDTDGVVQWTYNFPAGTYDIRTPALDQNGNFLCAYVHTIDKPFQCPGALLKLSPTGTVLFDKVVPMRKLKNIFMQELIGIAVDKQGRSWALISTVAREEKTKKGITSVTQKTYYDVVLYQPAGKKTVSANIYSAITEQDNGKGTRLVRGDPFPASMRWSGFCKGMFVIGGTETEQHMTPKQETGYSSWKVFTVTDKGRVKTFTYRDTGRVIDPVEHYKGDLLGNFLSGFVATNDAIYLMGCTFSGDPYEYPVPLKVVSFNPETKSVSWCIKDVSIGLSSFEPMVQPLPQAGLLAVYKDSTMHLYGQADGSLRSTLTFPAKVGLVPVESQMTAFEGNYFYQWDELPSSMFYKFDISTAFANMAGSQRAIPSAEPFRFALAQNYPNPFNPTTKIVFTLPADALVDLTVYNMLGQEVVKLFDRKEVMQGQQEIDFNAAELSSGVYLYRIRAEVKSNGNAGNIAPTVYTEVKKMTLLR